jgi:hypothetical protein
MRAVKTSERVSDPARGRRFRASATRFLPAFSPRASSSPATVVGAVDCSKPPPVPGARRIRPRFGGGIRRPQDPGRLLPARIHKSWNPLRRYIPAPPAVLKLKLSSQAAGMDDRSPSGGVSHDVAPTRITRISAIYSCRAEPDHLAGGLSLTTPRLFQRTVHWDSAPCRRTVSRFEVNLTLKKYAGDGLPCQPLRPRAHQNAGGSGAIDFIAVPGPSARRAVCFSGPAGELR